MRKVKEDGILFSMGSILYCLIELFWRKRTHWSMGITGGICLILLYRIDEIFGKSCRIKKCVLGSFIITTIEFIIGCIVNIRLGCHVWDYSKLPLNFMGQICASFTFLWLLLCIPAYKFCGIIKKTVLVKIK